MTGTPPPTPELPKPPRRRVLVFGATGTIGRATVEALTADGHSVAVFVRPSAERRNMDFPPDTDMREGDVTDRSSVVEDAFKGETFDAVISCLASRTGTPDDAWAVDYQANLNVLNVAQEQRVKTMIYLSAICVQRPRLEFQHAKLAFENTLRESGLTYSIVRPTAFFKSLSGQIDRARRGKPFLVFGNGRLTSCKPISDRNLGQFIAGCLDDSQRKNRILPVGGPGDAITPLEQGASLFSLLGRPPSFRHVPIGLLNAIIVLLNVGGKFSRRIAEKAELVRIGHYYATESMLLFNEEDGEYDADDTPSFGEDSLYDHYRRVLSGETANERVDQAVF